MSGFGLVRIHSYILDWQRSHTSGVPMTGSRSPQSETGRGLEGEVLSPAHLEPECLPPGQEHLLPVPCPRHGLPRDLPARHQAAGAAALREAQGDGGTEGGH